MTTYTAARVEGGLLSPDFLESITERDGQRPADFGADGSRSVLDEATAAWGDARNYWVGFQTRLQRTTSESPVTVTREQWVIPLLETLGYGLTFQRRASELDGRRYSISHRAGDDEDAPPVHIVGHDEQLGERNPSRSSQMAPHALLQDYLNRSEHLWGLVTNGRILRLLRDSTSFTRPSYIEFDLETIFGAGLLDEFLLLFRLAHRSRLPDNAEDAHRCLLERYHQEAIVEGGRIRDGLRVAVEEALRTLGNGFLAHPKNVALRQAVSAGTLSADGYYQELLYLIYRLLFLMVAEERQLLQAGEVDDPAARVAYARYREHLSMARLRALADTPLSAPQRFGDLYLGLRTLFGVLRDARLCAPLGLAPLNGELFATLAHLDAAYLNNRDLLGAVEALSYFVPEGEHLRRRVNYGALDVEELGSVYESLLDYRPVIEDTPLGVTFTFQQGTERKSTGSYYTRPELVNELVRSALLPVMRERLARTDGSPEAQQEALLDLTVCDPACGSGHFLLAAARRIGLELARVRSGEEQPAPEVVRVAVRDAITHCIYGVDRNPLAVDLCKVALWIEGYARGHPLTFLDYRIRCGDSLVGVFDLDVLQDGIPDDAYAPVSGDDRRAAREARDRNRLEREGGQLTLAEGQAARIEDVLERRRRLMLMPEDTPEQVQRKRAAFDALTRSDAWQRLAGACNLWTAAFYAPLEPRNGMGVPTTASVRECLATGAAHPQQVGLANGLAERLRFFHWPLEFPEVLVARGGFDVVLGNPPWEMIQLQEQEFFATRASAIARAPNKAARTRLIKGLRSRNPDLWREYATALHDADGLSKYLRQGGRFPLTGRGRINTYAVFAGLARHLLDAEGRAGTGGRAGIIVPTGIATDNTTRVFFGDVVEAGQLVSLYDFENREALFPGVHRSYKFSLLTLSGGNRRVGGDGADGEMRFAFFLTDPAQLRDEERRFALTRDDFRRINPNTRTCPIFRTRADAELTRKIYRRVPVLVNEATGENPWGVSFRQGLFNMSSDSHLFRTREELERQGYRLVGNRFVRGEALPSPAGGRGAGGEGCVYLPLYEAKMIWQFDHRFSSYEGVTSRSSTHLPDTTEAQHADACYQVLPWYWVAEQEVERRLWDAASAPPRLVVATKIGIKEEVARAILIWWAGWMINNGLEEAGREVIAKAAPCSLDCSPETLAEEVLTHWYLDTHAAEEEQRWPLQPEEVRLIHDSIMDGTWHTDNTLDIGRRLVRARLPRWLLGFRDITNTTNERTGIFGLLPRSGVGNNLPLLTTESYVAHDVACLLANLASVSLDFVVRQKLGGTHMNFFYVEQFPVLPAKGYGSSDLRYVIPRVLELVCTAWDLKPFADDVWAEGDDDLCDAIIEQLKANGRATGGHTWESAPAWVDRSTGFPPFRWDADRRAVLRAELDAYYARLYGLTRDELRYILDPQDVYGPDFPGETFRVLKEKEMRQYGEYRTRRLVLEAWDRLEE